MNKKEKTIVTIVATIIGLAIFMAATPAGREVWNLWFGAVQKADDATSYKTRKSVEDTCRAMIASYESDKLIYEQYRDSTGEEKRSWAEQAKMRANRTAATYNNYVLENSYIWSQNVPDDIRGELPYLS